MRRRQFLLSAAVPLLGALAAGAAQARQQAADPDADLSVARPAYPQGKGPRLAIDGGHNNFHTVDGRFAPFAAVARADGYRVSGLTAPLSAASLADIDLLVVANPLAAVNVGNWNLPTPGAYTPEEAAAVRAWVEAGGALLLIADHMPFPGGAEPLAKAFGFSFDNGFAQKTSEGPEFFQRQDGSLLDHPINRGIDRVQSFTGSSFRAPPQAQPLLVLRGGWSVAMPQKAWEFDDKTPRHDGDGLLRGAALSVGRGRVVVMGEAAMFTAQVGGPQKRKFGFNAPTAPQNKAFLLNVLRWLAPPP
ncbi:DUF4350 domain-containing protein [Caulobacter endophyticus]|uniref:DUF4350 domain-containing protein n=1 Tax=Caulobacter endophyticus TaxID=2172652 RepID=UPI0024107802|nr:DUF4350 domain-containing protein [Caulobacter endophyticus]MDG2531713.1 DUF4350 domain-containing protein [Caulobacter endophyticus]